MTCSLIGQTLTPDLQTDLTQKSWIKSSSVVSHWISFSCVHSAAPRHWWMLLQLNYSPPAGPSSVLIRPLWPTLAEDNCAFVWGRSLHDMDHTAVLCWSSWSGSYCCSLLVFVWKVSPVPQTLQRLFSSGCFLSPSGASWEQCPCQDMLDWFRVTLDQIHEGLVHLRETGSVCMVKLLVWTWGRCTRIMYERQLVCWSSFGIDWNESSSELILKSFI